MRNGERAPRRRGFTLIELLVVVSIITLLMSLVVPRYYQSVDRARQTVLAENLRQTRDVIDKFLQDTGRYPDSLDELVERRYLKALPEDPVLEGSGGWILVPPPPGMGGKVADLRSGASGKDRNGLSYAEY